MNERIARMDRIDGSGDDDYDESGDDEERELRREMRVSREAYETEQAHMDERRGGAGSSRAPPNPYEDTARRGSLDPFLHRTQSMKQPKISSSIMGDMKHRALKMGRAISKFFHYNRIPPNVATSPYYRAMVDTIAEVGPGVKPPSACEISRK
ncbi:putative Zinc finger, BED-type [Cinnamomum micranthum f. kanehirae]|uniref:Putative Zinc finger, BED-type n=1 Tax=Cinnamomum micranthum f. kanehirae TaxID=337451 RepID=A0A3S3Q0C3_9MAGN|nr:putative Zinc finger, BED-type [Cinnamomum micranthum f. kanehirae]